MHVFYCVCAVCTCIKAIIYTLNVSNSIYILKPVIWNKRRAGHMRPAVFPDVAQSSFDIGKSFTVLVSSIKYTPKNFRKIKHEDCFYILGFSTSRSLQITKYEEVWR